jgi:hypothetical protein
MNFELDDDQAAIQAGVDAVLRRHPLGDPAVLPGRAAYDSALDSTLVDAGYVAGSGGLTPLDATLVVMRVARSGAAIPAAAHILVAPLVIGAMPERPVALLSTRTATVRFGAVARTGLVAESDGAHQLRLDPTRSQPVDHLWAPAMARTSIVDDRGLGAASAERLRSWGQVGVAAEAVGLLDAAVARTLEHLRSREQFGRPIGSFQAVQHRLAELSVLHEGARWLTCEAAWLGAPEAAATTACTAALTAAARAVHDLHQVSGATGLTHEYGLHRFTFPLVALRAEMGGLTAQRRRLAAARWGQPV